MEGFWKIMYLWRLISKAHSKPCQSLVQTFNCRLHWFWSVWKNNFKLFVVLVFYHCISRWKSFENSRRHLFWQNFWSPKIYHINAPGFANLQSIENIVITLGYVWRFTKPRSFMWYTFGNQKFFLNKWRLHSFECPFLITCRKYVIFQNPSNNPISVIITFSNPLFYHG